MVEPLSKRVADLSWHVQLALGGELIAEHADLVRRLPSQLVFDHMGRPTLPAGTEHSSFAVMRGLIDKGRTWIKLSGAYSNSKSGPPAYPETAKMAQAFVKAAPERMVWGSDWPHPGVQNNSPLPNDAALFDLLAVWAQRSDAPADSSREPGNPLRLCQICVRPLQPAWRKAPRRAVKYAKSSVSRAP